MRTLVIVSIAIFCLAFLFVQVRTYYIILVVLVVGVFVFEDDKRGKYFKKKASEFTSLVPLIL